MTRDYTLRDLFWIIRRGLVYILGVTFAVMAVVLAVCTVQNSASRSTYSKNPIYSSSVDMQIAMRTTSDSDIDQIYEYGDVSSVKAILDTYLAILKTDNCYENASQELGGMYSAGELKGMVSFSKFTDTTLLHITAKSGSEQDSEQICEVYSRLVKEITEDVIQSGTAVSLGVTPAVAVAAPTVNTKLYCLILTVLAFIAASFFFIIKNVINPVLDEPDDVTDMHKACVIGSVKKGAETISFTQIASRLRYIQPDEKDVSLLIGCCDAKRAAAVAIGVAKAASASGSRVLLADCSFLSPQLGEMMNAKASSGLAEAVFGGKLAAVSTKFGFDLLTSGSAACPADEIIGEMSRSDIISRLAEGYDSVILFGGDMRDNANYITLSACANKAVAIARLHKSTHNGLHDLLTDLRITCDDSGICVILC